MRKNDFIKLCATNCNLSQKDMKEVLESIGETIITTMKDDPEGVTPFAGIKFSSVYKEGYTGRNPQTGEPVAVPAKYTPKVKFGKYVKEALN